MASNRSDGSYDTAYLVGAFDSDAQTSQVAYCSVGEWSGTSFSKVDTPYLLAMSPHSSMNELFRLARDYALEELIAQYLPI